MSQSLLLTPTDANWVPPRQRRGNSPYGLEQATDLGFDTTGRRDDHRGGSRLREIGRHGDFHVNVLSAVAVSVRRQNSVFVRDGMLMVPAAPPSRT